MDLRLCLYALVALAAATTTAATTTTTAAATPSLGAILQQTHRRALSRTDEDHIVDVEVSFYNDSKCEKPISEKGEPLISHWEIDSAEKYAQCRQN